MSGRVFKLNQERAEKRLTEKNRRKYEQRSEHYIPSEEPTLQNIKRLVQTIDRGRRKRTNHSYRC